VPERRPDEPLDLDRLGAARAPTGPAGLTFEVPDRSRHGGVVGLTDLLPDGVVGEGPQQRHGLRRPERQIEPRDLPGRMRRQPLPGRGVVAGQHRPELGAVDPTVQAEELHAAAEPPARRLTPGEVVVLHAASDDLEVVVVAARRPSARCSTRLRGPGGALPQCQPVSLIHGASMGDTASGRRAAEVVSTAS
jgi:hypothetical protein